MPVNQHYPTECLKSPNRTNRVFKKLQSILFHDFYSIKTNAFDRVNYEIVKKLVQK